ncbi:MAG TPA: diguanylate cyclase [Arenimonas sp.]|nr:diguanylate cyclase [Arenimonas sp.]
MRTATRWRLPLLAGLLVFSAGLLATMHAARLDQQHRISERRTQVQADLSDFRARLETEIYTAVSLVRGLSAHLSIQEDLDSRQFKAAAETLYGSNRYILNLSLAPGFVIRDIYPSKGSEMVIGLDLLADPVQKQAVLRAVQLDDVVLAGPYSMVQGVEGLTGRLPLWMDRDGVPRLWGVVNVSLDYAQLLNDAGIERLEKYLQLEIRGRDASGPGGEPVRGSPLPREVDAVKVPVFLPGGSWLISAAPIEGWYALPWWRTPTGMAGLALSLLSGLAVLRIAQDRQRIRLLAASDALTSLPNRRWALSHLARLMARSERGGETFAVLSFDLNGFKPVNDTYGHAVGDQLLAAIAQRLRDSMRPGDLVARMGGDEFLALVRIDAGAGEAWLRQLAERVQGVVRQPVAVGGHRVQVGTSIGVASFPRDGHDAATLLRRADEAMYRAKRGGGSGLAFAHEIDEADASSAVSG